MNPINYAIGLATELAYAVETGVKERETAVREQLVWVAAELDKVDGSRMSDAVGKLLDEAKAATAEALQTKAKRASAKTA